MSVLRFVVASVAAFALASALPAAVLAGPAWLGWLLVPALGQPSIEGAAVVYAHGIRLEDPYVLAGIPLFLGLWASSPRRSLALAVAGILVLEVVAGITLALVGMSVARGWIATPAREPGELVALAFVAAVRTLPVPLWMAIDPSWKAWFSRARHSSSR